MTEMHHEVAEMENPALETLPSCVGLDISLQVTQPTYLGSAKHV